MEVEDDVREKWKQHSQDGDRYANMSHLIRTAVANQIKYDREFDGPFNEAVKSGSSGIEGELEELKEDLNETLISLQSDINRLQVQAEGTENETLLSNLMSGFHDTIPIVQMEEIEAGEVPEAKADTIIESARESGEIPSDIRDIDARKALEELSEKVPTVKSVRVGEERYYFENQ